MAALSVLSSACIKAELPFHSGSGSNKSKTNRVSNKSTSGNEIIGDEKAQFQIISETMFKRQLLSGNILGVKSPDARKILENLPQHARAARSIAHPKMKMIDDGEESLLVGIPLGLLGQENMFGGVITKVSDKLNEKLGSLKLTDLSPIHVRPLITMPGGQPAMTLVGCASVCSESSDQMGLINFPIVGINEKENTVIIDLAPIGKELDLISMMDPSGDYTQLRAVSSSTTNFEYDMSTLVFDIKTRMIPVKADPTDETVSKTEFTVRWYLKLMSASSSYFESRTPTKGVGFFLTERTSSPKITRFSTTDFGKSVKYYIKNVPAEWKPVFAQAFDNWNATFEKIIDRKLLSYEFVDRTDPKAELLVPGDIRYNIMEWDLDNIASYGGLGPSIANQSTGETMSANVLIQGPTIIGLYTKWFELSRKARSLIASGRTVEANKIVAAFNQDAQAEMANRSKVKFALKLGQLDMTVHAQRAELEDPMIKNHFEIVPEGISFQDYMNGYFTEMLEHELGHNLGLRHNFKGNLGAYESEDKGSVSRSIMEYLGRSYRYKSAIGLYDKMAIAYGYRGTAPKHLNWFCTDEDQGSDKVTLALKSAECTKSDATSDPFSFWESRLSRAIDMLIDTKSSHAPVWKTSEIASQIDEAIIGLTAYAASAENTMATWTNFFGKADRPEDAEGIKLYVLEAIKKKLCNPKLAAVIAAKESAEASEAAQNNLDEMKKQVTKKASEVAVYTAEQLQCE